MQNERQMVQKEQLATKKGARVPGRDEHENRKMPNEVMTHEFISDTMSAYKR